ncbi:MAG: hypothetical protein AAB937_00020 [Patescibacteria group bacterium]
MPPIVDAVLLFALSIPVVMKYRILPIDGTPYWLFGVLFLALVFNVLLAYRSMIILRISASGERARNILMLIVLMIVVVGTSVTAMVDRNRVAPVWGVHDIILQEEQALRFLLQGKNPYKETYFGTPVESFHYAEIDNENAVNPALYHFVMPPWYLLFPFGFYVLGVKLLGFFDARMALLFCMVGLLLILWRWIKDINVKRLSVVLASLSPSIFDYFIEGRSDVFAFFWLLLSLYILSLKKPAIASFVFGLAIMSKQTIWIAVPFYFMYLYVTEVRKRSRMWVSVVVTCLVSMGLTLPFLWWDARAFIDSVFLYLTGGTIGSYPVSGYGFSMILVNVGIIKNIYDPYPFYIYQGMFGLPLLLLLLRWVVKIPKISTVLFSYGTFLWFFWYMSRYFNNSHIGYISLIFLIAGMLFMNEREAKKI